MKKGAPAASRSLSFILALSLIAPSAGGAASVSKNIGPRGISGLAAIGAPKTAPLTLTGPLGLAPLSAMPSLPAAAAPMIAAAAGADKATLAQALATAESLPAGAARDSLVSFLHAVSDQAHAGARIAQIFDAGKVRTAASQGDSAEEAIPEGVPPAAAALYKRFKKAAAARLKAFDDEVKQVKSGRYGIDLQWTVEQGAIRHVVAYTIDGQVVAENRINERVASGELPKEEWETARQEFARLLPDLLNKLAAVLERIERDARAVQQKLTQIVQDSALKSARATLAKGQKLQEWGLPTSIALNRKTALRYAHLYRLGGMPTDLGEALHDLLAPLVATDPEFLSRVTAAQLDEAVQALSESLKYSLDTSSPDGQKRARFNSLTEGYDYPEQRKALVGLARRKLLKPPLPGDGPAGLGAVSPERRPSIVLAQVLNETLAQYQSKTESGESVSVLMPLLLALHAALGVPVRTPQGPMTMIIKHRQLLPLVAELSRRNVHDDIVNAVIRTYPLGESLLRLGVHHLWARGLTGKGVKIAVIDNGVDFGHPDFSDVKNPVAENMTRDRGVHTKGDHGTPMASILHAIAPDAEIRSYQALSNTMGLPGVSLSEEETTRALIEAIRRARDDGAQIINMSLGTRLGYANDALAEEVTRLADQGVVVVVSAGNEGTDAPDGYQVRSPASSPGAIAVGAVNYEGTVHGNREAFGSQGSVFNPDDGTVAEKPEIWAYGVNVKAAARLPSFLYPQEPVPYQNGSGTSPAAPHVSGVVALMLEAAREAGRAVAKPEIAGLVRQALVAAAEYIDRHPVMKDAVKTVETYLALTRSPS